MDYTDIYDRWGNYIPSDLREKFQKECIEKQSQLEELQEDNDDLDKDLGHAGRVIEDFQSQLKDEQEKVTALSETVKNLEDSLKDRMAVEDENALLKSQLKERDELIIELWDLWQSFAEAGMLEINRNFIDSYPKFQKQIEDFNLKTQNKEDEKTKS